MPVAYTKASVEVLRAKLRGDTRAKPNSKCPIYETVTGRYRA